LELIRTKFAFLALFELWFKMGNNQLFFAK
jgi:hypothetical protein